MLRGRRAGPGAQPDPAVLSERRQEKRGLELTAGQILVGTAGSRVRISIRGPATRLLARPLRDFVGEMLLLGNDRFELDTVGCTYLDGALLRLLCGLSFRLAQSGFSRWSLRRYTAWQLELLETLGLEGFFEIEAPPLVAQLPPDPVRLRPLPLGSPGFRPVPPSEPQRAYEH